MTKNKPVKVFKAGGVKAAIWKNTTMKDGQEIAVHSVQIDRTYKQGEEYKQTNIFNTNHLPLVQMLLNKAYEFLKMKDPNKNEDEK